MSSAAPSQSTRPVSIALGLGVVFMPVVFIWFLFRAGYSARAQIIGCIWMGAVGVALLLSAPNGPLTKAAQPAQSSTPPPPIVTTILNPQNGSPRLAFELGETYSVHRVLRTPVALQNDTAATLKYVEVLCVFYTVDGKLLGIGLGNWVTVRAGKTVFGEVVASDIDFKRVSRRECRARALQG